MPDSAPKTKADLLALTARQPEGAFFQEHSRVREVAYINRSFRRWTEILATARARLPNLEKRSCLDVGVSPFTFLLGSHFATVRGLDLSGAFRPRCEAAGITLHEGGVTSDQAVAGIEKVDCIFFLEVLEHLHANPVEVLKRLRSVLREGGILVLSTPNMVCFGHRVAMLANRKLRHFTYPAFAVADEAHGFGHDRIYMPAELREYFQAAGFRRSETLYHYHIDDTAQANRSLGQRTASMLPALVKRLWPSMRDSLVMVGWV